MKIVCLGSLNIDRVYTVEEIVREGATISAVGYTEFAGGKGMNQSVALGRAGAEVFHLGCIGTDGLWLKELLEQSGVCTDALRSCQVSTGHAVIQVDSRGKNCIIVVPGANGAVTEAQVEDCLSRFAQGDILLMQNETSCVPFAMELAHKKGMKLAFNPSPITPELLSYPLDLVDYLILNETEGGILSGMAADNAPEKMLDALIQKYPAATIVLTLGGSGVLAGCGAERWQHRAYPVKAVDTTAAGDTFCGFFLAALAKGEAMDKALENASRAAALAVTQNGAVPSIPTWEEMLESKLFS